MTVLSQLIQDLAPHLRPVDALELGQQSMPVEKAESRARLEIGAASFRSLGYFCSFRGQARYAAARVEEQKRYVMSADQLAHSLKNFRTVKVSDKEESLSRSARRLLHSLAVKPKTWQTI